MSRFYDIYLEVEGHKKNRKNKIIAACVEEWWFEREDFHEDPPTDTVKQKRLTAGAQSSLCGGETEEEFTDRIAAAIWKANGSYCEVTVRATYLENLPFEIHVRDEDDYKKWKKKDKEGKGDNEKSLMGNRH